MLHSLNSKTSCIKHWSKLPVLTIDSNMKKNLVIIMLLCCVSLGCKEKCKDVYPVNAEFATMEIDFRSATGGFLISDSGSPYLPSDVSAYDDHQRKREFLVKQHSTTGSPNSYYLLVPIFYRNQSSWVTGKVYNQRVYIDLKGEKIALDYEFKIEATECSTQFEYLNVDYEGQRIASISHGLETKFTITK